MSAEQMNLSKDLKSATARAKPAWGLFSVALFSLSILVFLTFCFDYRLLQSNLFGGHDGSKVNPDMTKSRRLFDLNLLNQPPCQCSEFHDPFPERITENMRTLFSSLIQQIPGQKIELGPFLNPQLFGDDVKYFDVLDLEGLKERAAKINYPSARLVEIDYVSPTGDLTSIPDKGSFSLVLLTADTTFYLSLTNGFALIVESPSRPLPTF
jgi:hypothetical protein